LAVLLTTGHVDRHVLDNGHVAFDDRHVDGFKIGHNVTITSCRYAIPSSVSTLSFPHFRRCGYSEHSWRVYDAPSGPAVT